MEVVGRQESSEVGKILASNDLKVVFYVVEYVVADGYILRSSNVNLRSSFEVMRFVKQEAILIVLERVFGDLDASEVNL